ncbi:MAG: hypothetical protein LBL13_09320 [Bacteroidales bacterium]|jgi:hypothetical protein|nr:hypothetical protein [Bacteroidales bacterium]
MKHIFLNIIFLLSIVFAEGQTDVDYITFKGDSFIKISSDIIIDFLDQSTEDWETFMQQNDYEKKHEESGLIIYSKGRREQRFQAIGKNEHNILTIDWYDYDDKVKTTVELEESMENESIKKGDNIAYYMHNGHFIVVESKQDNEHIFERVYVIKK